MSNLKSIESYNLSQQLREQYQMAPRAGWDQSGKRGRDNHTILVNRAQVLDLTDRLRSEANIASVYTFERLNLVNVLEQLARGEHDAVICPECHRTYQTGWMNGQCVYCQCRKGASDFVQKLLVESDG
ncbi:hypothetical protein ACTQ33_00980 [Candidatus Avoscillospira sp. LCP25S3_F1]|uniref:hypothetical protein n=1 Tax=Candidatus Avoscillospira sp. LCP25S3_F1 TaxID=3438825 RepID=UPI003F8E0932